jgi:hypothetical protein
MSEPSIPPSNGDLNPFRDGYDYQMAFTAHQVLLNGLQNGSSAAATASKPTAPRRGPRKSGLHLMLHAAREHGITPPAVGGFLQLPREFDAILALEPKPVAQWCSKSCARPLVRSSIKMVTPHAESGLRLASDILPAPVSCPTNMLGRASMAHSSRAI